MAAFDPPRNCVGVNSQRLRETIGGIEAPVILEPHSFQLEVNSSYRARVSGGLQLEAYALVAHPRIARQNLQLPLAPGQLFGSRQAQFAGTFFQRPMRHTDLLGQRPDTGSRLRVSMVEIDLSDELVDLVGEDVLASALKFDAITITGDAEGCLTNRLRLARV